MIQAEVEKIQQYAAQRHKQAGRKLYKSVVLSSAEHAI